MRQGAQNGVQNLIQMFADILREKTQDEIPVLLEESVLAAIAAVGVCVGQVLCAIEFENQACLGTHEVHFHSAFSIEWDRKFGIQAEATGSFGQGFQSAKEEGFTGGSGTSGSFGVWRKLARSMNKQVCQRPVHAISDEPPHAGGVIVFPLWLYG